MLNRVWTAIREEDAENLAMHLEGSGDVSGEMMRELYETIPDGYKYSGVIYRGIGVEDDDVEDLFLNSSFTTSDMRAQRDIDSWSSSYEEAKSFAWKQVGNHRTVVVVLQDSIQANDPNVLMDLTQRAYNYVFDELQYMSDEAMEDSEEEYDEDSAYSLAQHVMEDYQGEEEIMIRHSGKEGYRLCYDVVFLYVDISALLRAEGKLYLFGESFDLLRGMIDEAGLARIKEIEEKGLWDKRSEIIGFRCRDGNLELD